MDASQLRSAISSLQSECSQIERENATMRSEISAICSSAQSATNRLVHTYNSAANTLQGSTNIAEYADQVLHAVSAEQDEISILYQGFKNIETANKRIRELNNKIYFEFANFRIVRKIVQAFIDNMSLEMVRPEMIYKAVEKEHLQSPDFWLSCCMLAIMHWRDNDENAAGRALEQAMKLDDRQTVLFFLSFNLLLGRKDAALKWFECYDVMEKTGDDAAFVLLLLHATNLREHDKDPLAKRIKDYLIREYENSKEMNDRGEMVEMIKDHLVQYNAQENFVFDNLRNYVRDYNEMAEVLSMAKDNSAVLDLVEKTNSSTRSRGYIYIEKFISELLASPDKKERTYTDEILYNELIIKNVGDITAATEEFNAKHERAVAPLNLMYECIGWLFGSQSNECSEVAKSNMFLLCRDLIEAAAKQYFADYRAKHKPVHPVRIRDYHVNMNLKNKEEETRRAQAYYEKKKASQLATVKNTSVILCIVLAVLSLAGGVALLIGTGNIIALGILAVVAAGFGLGALICNLLNKKKRKEIIASIDAACQRCCECIGKICAEYAEYERVYEESDQLAEEIIFAIKR